MAKRLELTPRLQLLADWVPQGARFADIGTDHALLPIYLVKAGIARNAIAADIAEGPLTSAASNIASYGLSDKITTVLSDGLEKIHSGAFKGCYNLSEIYISATVTEIGENAFDSLDKSFKIYGYKGSVAESTATLGKYEFIPLDHEYTADILGDITLDGKLNIRDATLLQKHLAGMTNLGETALKYADVDQNGKLNIRDATAIQKQISGLATVSYGGRFHL